jgi:hypothetical protein
VLPVVSPYVRYHPVTKIITRLYGADQVNTSSDEEAYYRLLDRYWRAGRGMIVVEHDILPYGLGGLSRCSRDWCVRPFLVGGKLLVRQSLGIAKFSPALQLQHPDLVEMSGWVDPPSLSWRGMDQRIAWMLRNVAGQEPHQHLPTLHFH